MKKFVEFSKRSKKEQKIANNAKRGNWGENCKVVTAVIPNKKKYNRKRDNKVVIDRIAC